MIKHTPVTHCMYRAQALATYISIPIKLIWPSLCLTVSYCTLLTVKYFYRYVYLLYLIVLYLTVPYLLYLYRYVSSCISGYRSHDKFKLITPDRAAFAIHFSMGPGGRRSRSPAERSHSIVQLSRDLRMLGNSRDTSTVDVDVEFVPVTT